MLFVSSCFVRNMSTGHLFIFIDASLEPLYSVLSVGAVTLLSHVFLLVLSEMSL